LILEDGIGTAPGDELLSTEGKNAGRITSVCFSPEMDRFVALAYVRYEFLADGTELAVGGKKASVKTPPFIAR
jgi:glycine cleavage system aminomethyltransferase T